MKVICYVMAVTALIYAPTAKAINSCGSLFVPPHSNQIGALLAAQTVRAGEKNAVVHLKQLHLTVTDPANLKMGSDVELQLAGEKSLRTQLIGRYGDLVYVIELKAGQLYAVSGKHFSSSQLPEIMDVDRQKGPTCAANSLCNLIYVLEQSGHGMPNSAEQRLRVYGREKFVEYVHNEFTTPDKWAGRLKKQMQLQAIESLLKVWKIPFSSIEGPEQVLESLQKGFPVLMGLAVGQRTANIIRLPSGVTIEQALLAPANSYENIGNHEVLAVGFVGGGKTLFGNRRPTYLITLDSATGFFGVLSMRELNSQNILSAQSIELPIR